MATMPVGIPMTVPMGRRFYTESLPVRQRIDTGSSHSPAILIGKGLDFMNQDQQSELAMLKLSLRDHSDGDYLEQAAEQIRRLTGVIRVRADLRLGQIEIVFQYPAEGFLRQVHTALQSVHCEIIAGKTV